MTKKSTKLSSKRKLQVGDEVFQPLDVNPIGIKPTSTVNKSLVMANDKRVDINQNRLKDPHRNSFSNIKGYDVLPLGLYAVDNLLINNDVRKQQQEFQRNLRNTLTQTPIYDYNYMYGPDSSGGTQYQNMIMAKQGASIRRGTSPDITNVEVEGGEFIQLPNLSTQHVYGPSHEKGGVHTNLPDGARVFSDHIKPFGSKKTYAQLAKKYDTEKYRKVLDNPYADDVDRNTAKLMFEKNQSILNELFEDQQRQNGNSDGTDQANAMGKFGLDLKKGEKLSFTDPFEYGGVYGGGYAEFQDGGLFPDNSTFYGGTYPDPSVLNLGTKVMQEGGYISPNGKKYKLPEDAVVKNEGDKGIKAGDYVRSSDGVIRKVTKVQAKMLAKVSKSSAAKDFAEGKAYINAWAGESPDNEAKLKRAEQIIAEGIKAGQIEEKKPAGWKEGDPVQITIKGNFKPSFKDRMIISEVINKSGKGFGTANYMITGQEGTEGYYDEKNKAGSFVGGMTPEDYEQRATYERALAEGKTPQEAEALATSTDAKQKLENRKMYLQELGIDFTEVPESYLKGNDFYKNHYQDITDNIERRFSEAGYKPRYGNDALSGWEHYDAASYTMDPSYAAVDEEQGMPPGSNPQYESNYKPYPSTLGDFPLYQATPEALGYMYANRPYSYYTPDYTHTEIAPPTLNIDPQLQAIDDSFQSAIRQNTGNASIGNARNAAMFNQALAAKQQAFGAKQNYDAEARFKADMYNAAARDQENVRDLTAASTIYNDYMAAAQDAAEVERLAAINSLVNKKGQFDRDEYLKAFYTAQLLPNYYYDGRDPRNPLKINPNNPDFYSKTPKPASTTPTTNTPQTVANNTPGLRSRMFGAPPVVNAEPLVIPELNPPRVNPGYGWSYDNFVPNIPEFINMPQPQQPINLYPGLPEEDYLPGFPMYDGKMYKK